MHTTNSEIKALTEKTAHNAAAATKQRDERQSQSQTLQPTREQKTRR
jgi:hypothetical protein